MIGRLRTRVGLYRAETSDDGQGGVSTTWPFVKALWASVEAAPPRESFENGRHEIAVRYKVTVRYFDEFPEPARILRDGQVLRVIAASDPDGRRERLHLFCEEERR